jgi:hypothetical protein
MLLLRESDRPKSLGEKIAEYVARPPQPILRFYGDIQTKVVDGGKQLKFAVRNGLPIPLLYGIYVETDSQYVEKTDHIGPWSVDDWCLIIDNPKDEPVEIRVGILPFEILTDRAKVSF